MLTVTDARVISDLSGGVLSVTFNRPKYRNAFAPGTPEELALGIIDQIVPTDALDAVVARATARFTKAPQNAIRAAKRLMDMSLDQSASDQLALETKAITECVATDDFDEGVMAFIEKRKTSFPSAQ